MKVCYLDTSGLLAAMDADDENHVKAASIFNKLILDEIALVCSSYVLLELCALIQHRLGLSALQAFHRDIFPLLKVEWIEGGLHQAGIQEVLIQGRKKLSLVDCVSFEVMQKYHIQHVFTFDKHFKEQGFQLLTS